MNNFFSCSSRETIINFSNELCKCNRTTDVNKYWVRRCVHRFLNWVIYNVTIVVNDGCNFFRWSYGGAYGIWVKILWELQIEFCFVRKLLCVICCCQMVILYIGWESLVWELGEFIIIPDCIGGDKVTICCTFSDREAIFCNAVS